MLRESSRKNNTYTALYRRFRPNLFSEVVGQEHVTRTLQNALTAGRVAHAYLFCGLRGTGKTTLAKLFSRALNCGEGVNPEPCNRCRSCREILDGRSMDVLELDAASNRGIDEIRDLREKVRYAPASSRYKVYIIDEVHMLTNEAFNALLKTLEEPPAGVIFILATTEVHKLPATVISRCQRFDFHLLEPVQVVSRLREIAEEMDFAVEEETLYLLARLAEGSVRDALGFLEQCRAYGGEKIEHEEVLEIMGLSSPEVIYNLLQAVIDDDTGSGLETITSIIHGGRDLHRFLRELILYLRKLLVLQVGSGSDEVLDDVPSLSPYLQKHRDKFHHTVILEMLEILQDLTYQLKGASQPQFLVELSFLRMTRAYRFRRYLSPQGLLSRLEELEEKLAQAAAGTLQETAQETVQEPLPESTEKMTPPATREEMPPVTREEMPPATREEQPLPEARAEKPSPELNEEPQPPAVHEKGEVSYVEEDIPLPEEAPPLESFSQPENEGTSAGGEDGEKIIPPGSTPEELARFWEDTFLPRLQREGKHFLHSALQQAKLQSRRGNLLTVALPASAGVQKNRIESPDNKKYLEALFTGILGEQVSLKVIQLENMPAPEKKPGTTEKNSPAEEAPAEEAPAVKREPVQNAGEDDYFLKQMRELFDGQFIEAKGAKADHPPLADK